MPLASGSEKPRQSAADVGQAPGAGRTVRQEQPGGSGRGLKITLGWPLVLRTLPRVLVALGQAHWLPTLAHPAASRRRDGPDTAVL